METRGGTRKEDIWEGWKEVWMGCEMCSMFVYARMKEDWQAKKVGAFLCGICLSQRLAKVESGKQPSEVEKS